MPHDYVEQRESGLYITGTRISLDSIVYAFLLGGSPESIQADWPTLSLEQVYGAITYYLANRETVEEYLRRSEREHADTVPPLSETEPRLYDQLQRARDQVVPPKR